MADQSIQVAVPGSSEPLSLPILSPTLGRDVIDVKGLAAAGLFTYDPGFGVTAPCESKITFIDGAKGELLYRGYGIEALSKDACYMEVCYLLIHGELPNKTQYAEFCKKINQHMAVPDNAHELFSVFARDAHPMAMLMSAVGALASIYSEDLDHNNPESRLKAVYELVAKIPTLSAMCYRYGLNKPFLAPREDLSYSENFVHMMFSETPTDIPNPILAKALDKIFILHADHEQNASTATVRLAGSTGTHPYAAIASGIAALWGPAHGGANEACLTMLKEIGHVDNIPEYIEKAKDKNDPFRLMGFGHRVYKNYDPRAVVMQVSCHEVLKEMGQSDSALFPIAMQLEQIALQDEYFIEKKLYPNVDFYSGITLSAMGIPTSMFTVLFALGRTVGWASHWHEMFGSADFRLGRPRQLYTGPTQREWVPMDKR